MPGLVEMDAVVGHHRVPIRGGPDEEKIPLRREAFDRPDIGGEHGVPFFRVIRRRSGIEKRRRLDEDEAFRQRQKIINPLRICRHEIREPFRPLERFHFAEGDEDDAGLGPLAVVGDAAGLGIARLRVIIQGPRLPVDGVALPREIPPAEPQIGPGEMQPGLDKSMSVEVGDLGASDPGDGLAGTGSNFGPRVPSGKGGTGAATSAKLRRSGGSSPSCDRTPETAPERARTKPKRSRVRNIPQFQGTRRIWQERDDAPDRVVSGLRHGHARATMVAFATFVPMNPRRAFLIPVLRLCGALLLASLAPGAVRAYDPPDFSAELFAADGILLAEDERSSLLEALAAIASNFPAIPGSTTTSARKPSPWRCNSIRFTTRPGAPIAN